MKNYQIEVSHIYNDKFISEEQIKSIEILKTIGEYNTDSIITVFVDDYNSKESLWDKSYLIEHFESKGVKINFIAYESNFGKFADEFISLLDKSKIRKEYFRKENKTVSFYCLGDHKIPLFTELNNTLIYSCTLLSTCWMLCRLEYFRYPYESFDVNIDKNISSEGIITILPNKYKNVENNVEKLILDIGLEEKLKNVKYYYF